MARGSGWFSKFGRHERADDVGATTQLTEESAEQSESSAADAVQPSVVLQENVLPESSRDEAGDGSVDAAWHESAAVDVSRETTEVAESRSPADEGVEAVPDRIDDGGLVAPEQSADAPDAGANDVSEPVDSAPTHTQGSVDNIGDDPDERRNDADLDDVVAGDNEMQDDGSEPRTPVDDDSRRAALIAAMPDVDESTPLAAELAQDLRRRIALEGRTFPRPDRTRIFTIANQKGGVGKTTSTVNLAAALAKAGLNVLVIDNDPQGNASTALGVEHHSGTPSIYEVLIDDIPIADVVQRCPDIPSLWCVPATIDLSGAEIELVCFVSREPRLRRALDEYLASRVERGEAPLDYVFVDCPPSLGLLTVNAFVVGREVLIPIQCEYYALEGLTQLLKTIALIQSHLNPELHVSTILLTMYDGRTNLAQQVAEEVRSHFPEQTLKTTVPRSVRISEAPSYGQTIMTYDPSSSGALAYLEAAREITERHHVAGRASSSLAPAARSDARQEN